MPVLGLGVWQMAAGAETEQAVEWALEAGYRQIDTAVDVPERAGASARRSPERHAARAGVRHDEAVARRMRAPRASSRRASSGSASTTSTSTSSTGRCRSGTRTCGASSSRCRSAGSRARSASATSAATGSRSCSGAARRTPAVNQVQFSPFHYRRAAARLLPRAGIVFEAYSPLARGQRLERSDDHRGRRAPRPDARAGDAPLGDPARAVVIPKSSRPGAHPLERPGVRLRAHRRTTCERSTRSTARTAAPTPAGDPGLLREGEPAPLPREAETARLPDPVPGRRVQPRVLEGEISHAERLGVAHSVPAHPPADSLVRVAGRGPLVDDALAMERLVEDDRVGAGGRERRAPAEERARVDADLMPDVEITAAGVVGDDVAG